MFCRWPVLAILVAASVTGCSEAPAPATNATTPAAMTMGDTITKPGLSAEDQLLADKQKNCPVGGEALGSMGTPIKVMVGERAVFLCCEGCRSAVEKDPAKYLAIIDAAAAAPTPEAPATPATETPAKP